MQPQHRTAKGRKIGTKQKNIRANRNIVPLLVCIQSDSWKHIDGSCYCLTRHIWKHVATTGSSPARHAGDYPSCQSGERRGRPWTGRQSITGPRTQTDQHSASQPQANRPNSLSSQALRWLLTWCVCLTDNERSLITASDVYMDVNLPYAGHLLSAKAPQTMQVLGFALPPDGSNVQHVRSRSSYAAVIANTGTPATFSSTGIWNYRCHVSDKRRRNEHFRTL